MESKVFLFLFIDKSVLPKLTHNPLYLFEHKLKCNTLRTNKFYGQYVNKSYKWK